MEFLHPAFAWLAAGGMIPVIIHLLHRQRFRRVKWGAMQFLLNAIKKTQRRIRIENLLLLLIRIAVMVLLALAIARPLFRNSPIPLGPDSNTNYIFVLDNSYSMGYKRAQATSLELARRKAKEILEKVNFSSEDTFTLLLCSEFPEIRLRSAKKRDSALSAIQDIDVSDYSTDMARTFQLIEEKIRTSENVDKRIYLFTDMQQNAWTPGDAKSLERFRERLDRLSNNKNNRVYLIDVGEPQPSNYSIVRVETRQRVATVGSKTSFQVWLYNFSPLPVAKMTVSMFVNGENKAERTVSLDPESLAVETFEHEFLAPGAYAIRFAASPDYLSKDDSRYLALEVKESIKVLVIDGAPGNTLDAGTKFLQLALDPAGEGRRFGLDVKTPDTLPVEDLDVYDAAYLVDAQFLTPEKLDKVRDFVAAGGGLFVALGPRVDKDFYNRDLWQEGEGLLPGRLVEVRGVGMELITSGLEAPRFLSSVRFEHPIFRTFRYEKMQPILYDLEFGQYWGVEPADEKDVFAAFRDPVDSPALIEKGYGEGRVMLFTSTINKDWNVFPIRSAFLPIMVETARYLASRPLSDRNLQVGGSLNFCFPVTRWAPEFRLTHEYPGQAGVVTLSPDKPEQDQRRVCVHYPTVPEERSRDGKPRTEAELRNEGIRHAGLYRIENPQNEEGALSYFAVNLGPRSTEAAVLTQAEGNLERINETGLRTLFPRFNFEVLYKEKAKTRIEASASSVWKTILFLILFLLLSESILACLFGRRKE